MLMLTALALAGCATAAAPPPTPAFPPEVEQGRRIAERSCAGCHAMAPGRASVDRGAPPFWLLAQLHTPESLQRVAADAIHDPHGMPSKVLTPSEAAQLIAYMKALQGPNGGHPSLRVRPCIGTEC
jgi:mono/diheme cytochrome c family protein